MAITFYDSLERAKRRIHQASTAAAIVKKVNYFFNAFVLHETKYASIQQSDADVVRRVQYKDCPPQRNGYDCGIFAVAMVLHLAEQIEITDDTFSQANVTQARAQLAETFASEVALMTSDVFRNFIYLVIASWRNWVLRLLCRCHQSTSVVRDRQIR